MYVGAYGILDFLWLLLVYLVLETTRPQAEQTKFKIYIKHGHLDYGNRGGHFQSSGCASITILSPRSMHREFIFKFFSILFCYLVFNIVISQ